MTTQPIKWRINPRHALIALAIFLLELWIALFVHDRIIRPFVGDILVVLLLYFAASSVLVARPFKLASAVLAFACAIELAQYFQLAAWLGLAKGSLLYVALGATADWLDVLAYVIGTALILISASTTRPKPR